MGPRLPPWLVAQQPHQTEAGLGACLPPYTAACPPRLSVPGAGLVETSTNLAGVKPQGPAEGGHAVFAVQCSTRSSLMPALEQVGVDCAWRGVRGRGGLRVGVGSARRLLHMCDAVPPCEAAPWPLCRRPCSQVRSSISRIGCLVGAEVDQVCVAARQAAHRVAPAATAAAGRAGEPGRCCPLFTVAPPACPAAPPRRAGHSVPGVGA